MRRLLKPLRTWITHLLAVASSLGESVPRMAGRLSGAVFSLRWRH